MKHHMLKSGTVRLRMPNKEDEAYCDQAQWVTTQDLHRIIFAPEKSRFIDGYLSTGGLLLLLKGYISRLESLAQ